MALTQEDQYTLNNNGSLLEIGAEDFYFKKLRPDLIKFNETYHTDRELNRTIGEVINKVDSAIIDKRFSDVSEAYSNLLEGINDKNYTISGPMRYGTEEEKQAIRDINGKFSDFSMILEYEKEPEKVKPPIRERLNYREPDPNGNSNGYNLDDLSNRGPKENKERIPNPSVLEKKYAY